MPEKVLIVEDDPDIASVLSRGLQAHGYAAVPASHVDDALRILQTPDITAAIVDVMIGEECGLDLVRRARASGVEKPMLMLSALSEVSDRMAGVEAGADDYVVKPFSMVELLARLDVQLRRPKTPLLDRATLSVNSAKGPVSLTKREFQVLELLHFHRGRVLSRGEIFDTLWLDDGSKAENVVDVYVGYLRKKITPIDDFSIEIKTIRGKGFTLIGTE